MPNSANVDKYDLIPFDYALRRYNALPQLPTLPWDPTTYCGLKDMLTAAERAVACPVCHSVAMRGFVRMTFPIGHELFGRAICCPRCWPEPFGHAEGQLSGKAQKIAAMWR